jgi:NAD(P)-dependent dehydrogenase (short-subunit alcohol dehydrogenase family)
LIVGVGPGFGYALAETLSAAGFRLALAARNAARLDPLVDALGAASGRRHHAYGCDATSESSVRRLFGCVIADIGVPELVVYAVQGFDPGAALSIEVCAFENSWRQNCLGAFITAREAGRAMVPEGKGTIIFVGSTSGMIGRAGHLNLAVGKFGVRALAQVMSRELWPKGIHVAHCVIDADIRESPDDHPGVPQSDPKDIAESILALHRQPRSAWTSEADLRPFDERFWEHC